VALSCSASNGTAMRLPLEATLPTSSVMASSNRVVTWRWPAVGPVTVCGGCGGGEGGGNVR